jgi:hypothetical protein
LNNFINYSVLILILFIAPVNAEIRPKIEVVGKSHVKIVPDGFSLTLTVAERGKITSKLEALVDKKIASVVNIAKKLSLKTNDITIAGVNYRIINEVPSPNLQAVKVRHSRQTSIFLDGQTLKPQTSLNDFYQQPLFEVSRQITLEFSNAKQYSQFLTQSIKIKVRRISSLIINASQQDEFYHQALLKAIDNAKVKASLIAKNLDVNLGKLQYIKEVTHNQDCSFNFETETETEMNENHLCNHVSSTDELVIKAKVLLKFSLKE